MVQAALGHSSQKVTQGYAKVVALQSSRVSGNVARLIGIGGASGELDDHKGKRDRQAGGS